MLAEVADKRPSAIERVSERPEAELGITWLKPLYGHRTKAYISVLKDGVGVSTAACRLFRNEDDDQRSIPIRVGVKGRKLIIDKHDDGPWRLSLSFRNGESGSGHVGGKRLSDQLQDLGFAPGKYSCRLEDGMLVAERTEQVERRETTANGTRRRGLAEVLGAP